MEHYQAFIHIVFKRKLLSFKVKQNIKKSALIIFFPLRYGNLQMILQNFKWNPYRKFGINNFEFFQ